MRDLSARSIACRRARRGDVGGLTLAWLDGMETSLTIPGGTKEIPANTGDPNGSGSAQLTIQGNTICGTFQFQSTSPNSGVVGTHIHVAASD